MEGKRYYALNNSVLIVFPKYIKSTSYREQWKLYLTLTEMRESLRRYVYRERVVT